MACIVGHDQGCVPTQEQAGHSTTHTRVRGQLSEEALEFRGSQPCATQVHSLEANPGAQHNDTTT